MHHAESVPSQDMDTRSDSVLPLLLCHAIGRRTRQKSAHLPRNIGMLSDVYRARDVQNEFKEQEGV